MYKILISKKVTKFILSQSSPLQNNIKRKINLLSENPYKYPSLDIKKMKGYNNIFQLRIGKIRFIYEIKNDQLLILVFTAGSRGDIYKGMSK